MNEQIHELHERGTQLFGEAKYSKAEPILNSFKQNPNLKEAEAYLGLLKKEEK